MTSHITQFAVNAIAERIGLAVNGRMQKSADGISWEFTPVDADPNELFTVKFQPGWRSAEAVFIAGTFAARLIEQMGHCGEEARHLFVTFVSALEAHKVRVTMRINGAEVVALQPAGWPHEWLRLDLVLRHTPIVIDQSNEYQLRGLMLDLLIPLFGMLAALIGVEETELPTQDEPEGRTLQTIVTRYERKRVNREACIQLKGTRCCVCGFDFAAFYGPVGLGYIEIHHTTPLSSVGADYHINIATDLEPLCANCHAMAHREDPPMPVQRLKEIVDERRGGGGF